MASEDTTVRTLAAAFILLLATGPVRAGADIAVQKVIDAFACTVPAIQMIPDGLGGVIGAINPATCTNTRPGWLGARFTRDGYSKWPTTGISLVPAQASAKFDGNGATVPDGSGGAFGFWRNAFDVGVLQGRHVTAAGTADWGESESGARIASSKVLALLHAAPAGAGGSIVAWLDLRPPGGDLPGYRVLRLDGAGAPMWKFSGVLFAQFDRLFDWFRVVPDGAGGAWLVGRPEGTTALEDLYVNRVAHDGTLPFGIFAPANSAHAATRARASAGDSTAAPEPCAIADGSGGVILVASEHDVELDGDLFALRLAPDGTAVWGTSPVAIDDGPGAIVSVDCAPDTAGGLLVTWSDGSDVYAQRMDAFGQKQWGPLGVQVSQPQNIDTEPSIADVDPAGALIAWISERHGHRDVVYDELTGDGASLGEVSLTSGEAVPWSPQVHSVPGVGFIMWIDGRDGVVSPGLWDSYDLYASRFPLARDRGVGTNPDGPIRLAGFAPNPARGVASVSFTLPVATHARIELLDLSGRSVARRELEARAGLQHIAFPETMSLPPGAYWIRLQAAGKAVQKLGILLR